jgi:hypothetical protein
MSEKMENSVQFQGLAQKYFELRALVLALGETAQPAWWKTEFMNETGLRFLERLYPRTSFHAAVHAAGKAASEAHDRAVGRIGAYHLFRLPESLEAEMNRLPPDLDEKYFSQFRAAVGQTERMMELLASLFSGAAKTAAATGAKRIGSEKDLMSQSAFEIAASTYYNAFKQGKLAFPYFSIERSTDRV